MRLLTICLFLAGMLGAHAADPSTNTPPRALPVSPSELTDAAAAPAAAPTAATPAPTPPPLAIPGGVNIHWYGHGFIYLTSSVGVRAAIDPFGSQTVHYHFPDHLQADFVLISHEAEDHAAADMLYGNPLIFRSVTAVGLNRANGIPFRGISLQKDPSGEGGSNTAFTLTFDGIRFCYLGQISQPLLAEEKEQIGQVDVVFLPVGLTTLPADDMNKVVADLGAKVIVPINYKTDFSGIVPLRTLDEYLAGNKYPVHKLDSSEFVLTRAMLPTEPTVFLLKSP